MTPFRPRQRTDSNGRVCCEDNSEAIEANRDKAELMTSLMKNMTAIEVMQVESRGAGRFRVSRRQDSMTGAWVPSESAEVDLDSRR